MDVAAVVGAAGSGEIDVKGEADDADVIVKGAEEKEKGWSFTTWIIVIVVVAGVLALGGYGVSTLFASSSDSSANAESPSPPAPPGASYVPAVRLTTVVSGTVASFDENAYKNLLAAILGAGVRPSDITLAVSAGSVVVEAMITADTDAALDGIMTFLNEYDKTTLGHALKVTIEQPLSIGKTRGVKIYPPPSPPPTPPPTPPPPSPPP